MPVGRDPSPEFLAWRREPGRSVAGALVGLVLAWLLGGALVLGMLETRPGSASVTGVDFALAMGVPLAVGCAACGSRRVRCWGGSVVAGAVAGWFLGILTFLGLALLAVVT